MLILFDTGGVRLQEANAGELAIAEVMRAVIEVRAAGVPVIGLIGGRAGCYGGGGLIAGTCSRARGLGARPHQRLGPEVIETNKGVEEFDSRDRALVWRTMGGKHRRLPAAPMPSRTTRSAAFRAAALRLIGTAPAFDLATLEAEQARLEERSSASAMPRRHGDLGAGSASHEPAAIPAMRRRSSTPSPNQLGETTP